MSELLKVNEAVNYIKNVGSSFESDIAIIGLNALNYDIIQQIPYSSIPNFPLSKNNGDSGTLILAKIKGKNCYILNGNFHLYEGHSLLEIIRPIRILKYLGVKKLIVTNYSGAVNLDYEPGDIMLINDHINFGGENPLMGQEALEFGPRFPSMEFAYNKEMQNIIRETALAVDVPLNEGVYIKFFGPSYETPAEVKIARILGADAIGMSMVYECIAAIQCGLSFAGISCITNMAAGISNVEVDRAGVLEVCNTRLSLLLTEIILRI